MSKNGNIIKDKLKNLKAVVLILALISLVSVLYHILLRPILEKNMITVVIETSVTMLILVVSMLTLVCLISSIVMVIFHIVKRKQGKKLWFGRLAKWLLATVGVGAIFSGYVLYTQKEAYTPPVLNEYGDEVPGSISSIESVNIGEKVEWITARGKNKDNPVILFLSETPGESSLASTRRTLSSLEEDFVVVNWEQPGAGKSYNALDMNSISIDTYISDGYEISKYLCKKFNKNKIYVVGESWGGILGIKLIQRHPELYDAFVGIGQMVSFNRSNSYSYYTALELAAKNADDKELRKLKAQGAPPYLGDDVFEKEGIYLDYLNYHVAPESNKDSLIANIAGPEYGLIDKFNIIRGNKNISSNIYHKIYNVDLLGDSTNLQVPVYFLQGKNDVYSPGKFVEEYYNSLNVPHKELIWFEKSGHDLWVTEGEKFTQSIKKYL
ncbi:MULTISPECIES: alpha/beta hydrolase [Clostridium]|uniref:Alpha/beta hydrolase n=1 Tax=Clostridium cibarium TaxID=2762247 RepID=A0ABR8PT05_9CLOT|nr:MULTISPECIES: alpha/beta hydrolase [Clostridium]MBD7911312.1 alpha/beta hydrolase [Clostridium cibarium]